ncbi:M20 family metallopeptidase [Pectinatus sottacetonis]|uniref:M20 family metallopeptidase n=1 Tax=Pectinatus sottacetonis TaxID=1002795 RepID=UPI0018C7C99C|nr:M20 family metallopeptidase [Pectinatus sottacetonis]
MNTLNKKNALALLKMLIETNTVNPPGNETFLADKICHYLQKTPVSIQKIPLSGNRCSLTAVIKGTGRQKPLILCGHMDTVPYGQKELWNFPPDKLTYLKNRCYGRGASDMKSGLAAILYAFKQTAQTTNRPAGDIILALTADEETDGAGATALSAVLPLKTASAMIIAEPTGNDIGITSKGTLWLDFNIYGQSAHGAYPQKGINAIKAAYKIHQELEQLCNEHEDPLLKKSTCTITKISGGAKINMVADFCNIKMDIRTIPLINNELFLQKIASVCSNMMQNIPGLHIKFSLLNNRPPVSISQNAPAVSQLSNAIQSITHIQPKCTGINFFSDASIFVQQENTLPCILFGPGKEYNAHITNEYVEDKDYFASILCYNKLLLNYFAK